MHRFALLILASFFLRMAGAEEAGRVAGPGTVAPREDPAGVTIWVTVEGAVQKPGTYRLRLAANLLHALAEAGGIKQFGIEIRLIRRATPGQENETLRIKTSVALLNPPELRDGDVIKVAWACVAAGSSLITPDGPRLIEEIKVGDEVLGFDFGANRISFGWVISIHEQSATSLLVLNNRLAVTSTHPVWTADGWIQADLLRAHRHELMTPHGRQPLTEISRLEGERRIFDLTVERTSCFFADEILVHNKF